MSDETSKNSAATQLAKLRWAKLTSKKARRDATAAAREANKRIPAAVRKRIAKAAAAGRIAAAKRRAEEKNSSPEVADG